jgi:hypothetical protein
VTTHKTHVNLLHNQCLAIQTLGILLSLAARRSDKGARATYRQAARRILPDLLASYEGSTEDTVTPERPRVLPMMIAYCERVDAWQR